jgi:hypothetical protein
MPLSREDDDFLNYLLDLRRKAKTGPGESDAIRGGVPHDRQEALRRNWAKRLEEGRSPLDEANMRRIGKEAGEEEEVMRRGARYFAAKAAPVARYRGSGSMIEGLKVHQAPVNPFSKEKYREAAPPQSSRSSRSSR